VSDLVIVNGDLTLDGVLNITAGTGFDTSSREIFKYTGTLFNNGLTIGALPAGYSPGDFTLDFSMPGKVNLRGPVTGTPGDYNSDGFVNAADYTTWRDALDAGAVLPNDTTPGSVTAADYTVWVNNYGIGSSLTTSASVPEPATLTLLAVSSALTLGRRRSASSNRGT
jgi:hypothetical protein